MEGPTPVSALIHAATMVTAGVYLIVRSGAIFDAAPQARTAVIVIGAITLIMGAIIGCAKDDIKKALAGSTMSQIGYMILAAGLGPVGYAFAIFHLLRARLLQGRHVPRCRLGHARHERPGEHAALRCAAHGHDGHLDHLRLRLARDHGRPAVLRLLHQGQDHRGRLVGELARRARRAGRRGHHGVLHDPPVRDDLPRQGALDRRRAPARVAVDHDVPGRDPRVPLGGRGLRPQHQQRLHRLARAGHRASRSRTSRSRAAVHLGGRARARVLIGVALAWIPYATACRSPRSRRRATSLTRAARADLYGDAVNEAVFMRPGQYLTRWLVWFDNRVVDGARQRHRRRRSAASPAAPVACRPASPGPTRCPCSAGPPSSPPPSCW